MSWMNLLYQTYDNNILSSQSQSNGIVLPEIAHMIANVQIEIVINSKGEYQNAYVIDKKEGKTLIPVTEASAGRSNGIAPHALCDTLSYIAGDYGQYVEKKEGLKAEEKHKKYIENLEKWVDSEYSHPKIKAVRDYIVKNEMIKDLAAQSIVKLDTSNMLSKEKINGNTYEKSMVRFRVIGIDDGSSTAVWEDRTLIKKYVQYYLNNQPGVKDICYITGEKTTISVNHPKGIVAENYGAKLISANDVQNYTFRGRFASANQACTIGYEATQKAHLALTWLAARQRTVVGTKSNRTYICWNPNGKETPQVDCDFFDSDGDDNDDNLTQKEYAVKVRKLLDGYEEAFDDSDLIAVIALDAATTGRLSIVYYNELAAHTFFERLFNWHCKCNWYFTKFTSDSKPYNVIMTPNTKDVIKYAFGNETGKFVDVSDKILKEQVQRIYSCMLDNKKVPYDIVRALCNKVSMPQSYSTRGNWERLLSITCSMLKIYFIQNNYSKGDYMILDLENNDRSYLYGRLLAVLEKMEKATYDKTTNRETNAMRYMNAYVNHPFVTWKCIYSNLQPYMQKMSVGSREYYKNIIEQIVIKLNGTDQKMMNKALEPQYLMGYYLERAELNKNSAKKDEGEEA